MRLGRSNAVIAWLTSLTELFFGVYFFAFILVPHASEGPWWAFLLYTIFCVFMSGAGLVSFPPFVRRQTTRARRKRTPGQQPGLESRSP